MILFLMFAIGVIAGLRAMTAPAVVCWAAKCGQHLGLQGSVLAFLGYKWTAWIWSLAAIAEIINDKLPGTPSRKVPPQFIVRILMGAMSGGAIGISSNNRLLFGIVLGALGAIVGTLGGSAVRTRLARAFGHDLPAALLEDVVAVGGGILIMVLLP